MLLTLIKCFYVILGVAHKGRFEKVHMGSVAKILIMLYVNFKCADQPAHLCSLISTFVICSLERITCQEV